MGLDLRSPSASSSNFGGEKECKGGEGIRPRGSEWGEAAKSCLVLVLSGPSKVVLGVGGGTQPCCCTQTEKHLPAEPCSKGVGLTSPCQGGIYGDGEGVGVCGLDGNTGVCNVPHLYPASWMEACLSEELPPLMELEETLRNGVVLAKLGHCFAPTVVPLKKIYDCEQTQYKVRLQHWRLRS